ncbi:MAG: DUF5107 domain-containing protein [Eubacteriales bacterium]|nr:DUF5107 domain-containing protein [Eubacteriales bacterium]
MTKMTVETLRLPMAPLGPENPLPPIAGVGNVQQRAQSTLDESDGLYLGYGFVNGCFPYRTLDGYGEELTQGELPVVVLENKYLRAELCPTLGGKLRSLIDLQKGRELLYCNPVIRPRNLAVRNAWTSGGVEWNCGVIGHTPYTCQPVFAARTALQDGTPVLRLYAFERIRAAVYQLDIFLPQDSRQLYVRTRIYNPHKETIPMYWWSNIAVPENDQARVLVPAQQAYTHAHGAVSRTDIPMVDGIDVTYPTHNPGAVDYFWKVRDKARRAFACLDGEGYGLCQCSTDRLQGRKLFVWGQTPGSRNWERFLTGAGDDGCYVEIQAGLARTQYECLPMPPQTAWEWLEAYGPMEAEPSRVHGDWQAAQEELLLRMEALIPRDRMDELLAATHAMAVSPADEVLFQGDGWGALEVLRRERQQDAPLCPWLDFGRPGQLQEPWKRLLLEGSFGEHPLDAPPESWMLQQEWIKLMQTAVSGPDQENAYAQLELGMSLLVKKELKVAAACLRRSLKLRPSAWAMYGLSYMGEPKTALNWLLKAVSFSPDTGALAVEALRRLLEADAPKRALALEEGLPQSVRATPRVRLYRCTALVRLKRIKEAEALYPTLCISDLREGELGVTKLWFELQEAKSGSEVQASALPTELDFRTHPC